MKRKNSWDNATWNCSHCGESGHNVLTCQNPPKPPEVKRKRGAQPGNFNALEHGFYSRRFLKGEIEMLDRMEVDKDVSSEIKLLSIALDRAAARLPDTHDIDQTVALLSAITNGAAKLSNLKKNQKFLFDDQETLSEFLERALSGLIQEYQRQEGDAKDHPSSARVPSTGLKDASTTA